MRIAWLIVVALIAGVGWYLWSGQARRSPGIEQAAYSGTENAGSHALPAVDARTIAAMRSVYADADANTGVLAGPGDNGEFAAAGADPSTAPIILIDGEAGPVLITATTSDDAAHAASGFLSAFYLRDDPSGGYQVTRSYVDFGGHGEWGQVGRVELISLDGRPALLSRFAGGGMGCLVEVAAMYAFPAGGPLEVLGGEFVSYEDNGSFSEGDEVVGAIVAPPIGYDMALRFTGQHFGDRIDETVLYRLERGRLIVAQGQNPLAGGC